MNISAPQAAETPKVTLIDIHQITEQQLQMLGLTQLAYIKLVATESGPAYAIHAADGTPMALAADAATAIAAVHEHHMAAALVH
jgi:hypothetical protein